MSLPRTLVLGIGNPVLRDDGVGWRVVEEAQGLVNSEAVEIDCIALGGLSLMERLIGYERAILVDAIHTEGGSPGTVYRLGLDDLPTLHANAIHDASLKDGWSSAATWARSFPARSLSSPWKQLTY